MTAISVSPDLDLRRTTPPAALITFTSAISRIFVATVAPSSAETFGCGPCAAVTDSGLSLTANRGAVEVFDKVRDAGLDVIADRARLRDRHVLRVTQIPVDVPLARDDGTRIPAAHHDHD